ncbi:MAG: c-type cytochrome [Thermomonas sp.]
MRIWLAVACVVLAACSRGPDAADSRVAPTVAAVPAGDPVEGARIARRVGCDGCHDEGGKGGGFDVKTPQGDRVVAPNLTVRRALYDDAGIARLLHEGKTHDGHRPFGMPIFMFQHLSDGEVRDIAAWLRALPTVDNPNLAETHLTPATRKSLLDGTHPYASDDQPDPGNLPPRERPVGSLALGKYLAYTTCTECHGRDLNGFEGDDAPTLVVAKAYTSEKFARLMKTGEVTTGGMSRTGRMSKTATYRFAPTLTDVEITAIKQYLDSR